MALFNDEEQQRIKQAVEAAEKEYIRRDTGLC